MNNIRDFLCEKGADITESSGNRFATKTDLLDGQDSMRKKYLEMMGIVDLSTKELRTPLNAKITAITDQEKFIIERLYFESLPQLYVTANLYIPKFHQNPMPAIIYCCGHSPGQKSSPIFQSRCRRFAELGFVTLVIDTIQYVEIEGDHHGPYLKGLFNWYSRGYTPAGVELWNAIRGIDFLEDRPEVDSDNIGVTGLSGGGVMSWWLAAADTRVKISGPVCGTGTLRSHFFHKTIDSHCDCAFFTNYEGWDLADLAALIAPRKLTIASSNEDLYFAMDSIRECYKRAKGVYDLLGVSENITLIENPGKHAYHEISRKGIYVSFLEELKGDAYSADSIEDAREDDFIDSDMLSVYTDGAPKDERVSSIYDSFVGQAKLPIIANYNDFVEIKSNIITALRRTSFSHFPEKFAPLESSVDYAFKHGDIKGQKFSFTPEANWRLSALMVSEVDLDEGPIGINISNNQMRKIPWPTAEKGQHTIDLETRGVGDTSWGDDLAWHVRRGLAACGMTMLSLRILDTLRAIELARSLKEYNGSIYLKGSGEMAVVAIYAALLDGEIEKIFLNDLPRSHNVKSPKNGTGEALELLGVLRFTDISTSLGLLYPTKIKLSGQNLPLFSWSKSLHKTLSEQ